MQLPRQVRFTSVAQIEELRPVLKDYIQEAIEVEKSGAAAELPKSPEPAVPEELERKFAQVPGLKEAFEALTPGRRRAYLLHFSGAKQAKTREARIEKYIPHILSGKGMND